MTEVSQRACELLADERGAAIETALRDMIERVGDALARGDRLYASNRIQLQKSIEECWQAINLDEPDRRAQIARFEADSTAGLVEALIPILRVAYACGYTDRPGDRNWSDNVNRLRDDLEAALRQHGETND